jgi:hypothetical protein
MKHSDRVAFRKKARNEFANNELEVDNDARVSGTKEEGAWVKAWVWVELNIKENKE